MACSSNIVSVQELVRSCGLEEASLESEVTYVHFDDISRYLSKWKRLATKMTISQPEVDDIESDHPNKAEMQKVSFLDTWKQKMTFKATYRVLMEALLSIGRAEDARGVCQILRGKSFSIGN